ncbi:MAG: DJ-1/PfpI family protein [Clostridia bacterium]|nr:DJ-1/PfpI family protein [Clostridia bacterium]
MTKIAVLIANGSEEIETLTPLDIFRRCENAHCDLISVSGKTPTCSHGVCVCADKEIDQVNLYDYDAVVIPGGMPGATNISNDKRVITALKKISESDKLIASICASPAVVLAKNGLLGEQKATCYPAPAFIELMGDNYTGSDVEVGERLITANGPKSAMQFSIEICKALGLKPKF